MIFKDGEKELAEGTAYLGNCSYRSAEDFVKTSGYFEDMVKDATKEALENLERNRTEREYAELEAITDPTPAQKARMEELSGFFTASSRVPRPS